MIEHAKANGTLVVVADWNDFIDAFSENKIVPKDQRCFILKDCENRTHFIDRRDIAGFKTLAPEDIAKMTVDEEKALDSAQKIFEALKSGIVQEDNRYDQFLFDAYANPLLRILVKVTRRIQKIGRWCSQNRIGNILVIGGSNLEMIEKQENTSQHYTFFQPTYSQTLYCISGGTIEVDSQSIDLSFL